MGADTMDAIMSGSDEETDIEALNAESEEIGIEALNAESEIRFVP